MAKTIQQTDPDSASFENPIGPKDCSTLAEQLQQAKFTGEVLTPRAPHNGYPDRQG